jgi:hypothetical protein
MANLSVSNMPGILKETNTETLSDNKTLIATSEQIQYLDPGGSARDITLPAEASSSGLEFIMFNTADADETLTVKDDTPATVGTIKQGESNRFVCDGTTWKISAPASTASVRGIVEDKTSVYAVMYG